VNEAPPRVDDLTVCVRLRAEFGFAIPILTPTARDTLRRAKHERS